MGKVKNWTVEKKDQIELILIHIISTLGMDIPSNFEDIVQYCYEDVCETADPVYWSDGDVAIAFHRYRCNENVRPDDYFKVTHTGFCKTNLNMRKYTLEQVSIILLTQNWHSCVCENEKDGEHCPGFDTIKVGRDNKIEVEYFGEFIRDVNENTYTFKFYI